MRGGRAAVFTDIYDSNAWNGVGDVKAGPGSHPDAVAALAEEVNRAIGKLGITSLLDAGCGDGMWVPDLKVPYIGVDVVPYVIARCHEVYPDRDYRELDFVADPLPPVDAVLCRDALQHLSLRDGVAALDNFARAGARFLLASSHRGAMNQDIVTGGWYPVNLETVPFGLGDPIRVMPDDRWPGAASPWPDKVFGTWVL